MPFLTTAKNFESVIRHHLAEGEELIDFFGVPRRVVGLTDKRFIVSNFPFFGAPKTLIDAPIAAIESFDIETQPQNVLVVVTHGGQTQRDKLQSVLDDVTALLAPIRAKLLEANSSIGGAPYFAEGETEVGTLPTKDGMLRVSDQHVFLVNKKARPDGSPQVDRKIAHADVTVFDFYQSTMGSMRVVLGAGGTTTVYQVGPITTTMAGTVPGAPGIYDDVWTPSKMADAIGGGRPDYLEAGERLRYSVRTARSSMGAIKPSLWARLTDRRLLVLGASKDGTLELEAEVPIEGLTVVGITKHLGEQKQLLNFEIEFGGPQPFKLWIPSEHEEAFNGIVGALRS